MAAETPLTCRDTTWLVSESRDRELSAAEIAGLCRHIEDCPHCRIASRQFEALFAQVDALFSRYRGGGGLPALPD
jgi:anti-sigma factor RsiW